MESVIAGALGASLVSGTVFYLPAVIAFSHSRKGKMDHTRMALGYALTLFILTALTILASALQFESHLSSYSFLEVLLIPLIVSVGVVNLVWKDRLVG